MLVLPAKRLKESYFSMEGNYQVPHNATNIYKYFQNKLKNFPFSVPFINGSQLYLQNNTIKF